MMCSFASRMLLLVASIVLAVEMVSGEPVVVFVTSVDQDTSLLEVSKVIVSPDKKAFVDVAATTSPWYCSMMNFLSPAVTINPPGSSPQLYTLYNNENLFTLQLYGVGPVFPQPAFQLVENVDFGRDQVVTSLASDDEDQMVIGWGAGLTNQAPFFAAANVVVVNVTSPYTRETIANVLITHFNGTHVRLSADYPPLPGVYFPEPKLLFVPMIVGEAPGGTPVMAAIDVSSVDVKVLAVFPHLGHLVPLVYNPVTKEAICSSGATFTSDGRMTGGIDTTLCSNVRPAVDTVNNVLYTVCDSTFVAVDLESGKTINKASMADSNVVALDIPAVF